MITCIQQQTDVAEDQAQPSRAFTPDPDITLIQAFKQLSSPSAQRVYDVSPLLDQYVGEDRSESPTPQRNYILKSMDSFFQEKNKIDMLGREFDDEVEFLSEKKLKFEDENMFLSSQFLHH